MIETFFGNDTLSASLAMLAALGLKGTTERTA